MQPRTHQSKMFLPAVLLMLFLIILVLSFGGKKESAEPGADIQAEQCKALCDAINDCSPGQLQAFALADCAGYSCSKEADCTNVTCGGNTPEELKQALGC